MSRSARPIGARAHRGTRELEGPHDGWNRDERGRVPPALSRGPGIVGLSHPTLSELCPADNPIVPYESAVQRLVECPRTLSRTPYEPTNLRIPISSTLVAPPPGRAYAENGLLPRVRVPHGPRADPAKPDVGRDGFRGSERWPPPRSAGSEGSSHPFTHPTATEWYPTRPRPDDAPRTRAHPARDGRTGPARRAPRTRGLSPLHARAAFRRSGSLPRARRATSEVPTGVRPVPMAPARGLFGRGPTNHPVPRPARGKQAPSSSRHTGLRCVLPRVRSEREAYDFKRGTARNPGGPTRASA